MLYPKRFYVQNGGRLDLLRASAIDPLRAFASVVTKYFSRSRSNFSWVALKFAILIAISSRSRARRSSRSVMAIPLIRVPRPLASRIGARIGRLHCRIVFAKFDGG